MKSEMKTVIWMVLAAAPGLAQLPPAEPASVGMSAQRLQRAAALLESEVKEGKLGAAAILVARRGNVVLEKGFGRLAPDTNSPAVKPGSIFLLASITKPVTACALMLLVERGLVSLNDPVSQYLPEFTGGERNKVRVRDLLSHTSGLPDMLPENTALRRAHEPLSIFVAGTMKTPLLYTPQEDFRYQSMGVLLAGEIVERITKMRLRDFERKEIFEPLGMKNSALGIKPGWRIEDTVQVYESPAGNREDRERFGANSAYWRDMGHPWGGMHSTVGDLAILMQTFLNKGSYAGKRWMSPATVAAMTTDQNTRLHKPWGLGWALAHSTVWIYAGELVSARTFGHAGATGTVVWADPESQLLCVILTNRPISIDGGRLLRLVSNAVSASVS
jgi:CubicO group peptidase (beta-lactamase class C family)